MNNWTTKRVAKCAGIAWLCLLVFVFVVRAANLSLGSVQPEAVMLTFIMTLPFTVVVTVVVVGGTAVVERRSVRNRTGANPEA